MPRLKSRQRSIPYGFRMYIPETKWAAPDGSFDSVVNNTISHIQAHPELQAKGWQADYGFIAERVDAYNAAVCRQMGWNDWITEGGGAIANPFQVTPANPPPPPMDQNKLAAAAASLKKMWVGVKTLNDWIDSGEPAVAPELSAKRAKVCSTCPKNGQGDLTSWFTKPASEAIRKQLEKVQERKLSTPFDDKLNICEVCFCPMKLKAHVPIVAINAHLGDATRAELKAVVNPSGGCWMIAEIWPERHP
jgi:hypothetical protein